MSSPGPRIVILLAAASLLALGWPALGSQHGETASSPPVIEPLPFDHQAHERVFARASLQCLDCHPVGAKLEGAEDPQPAISALRSSCHACHLQEVEHAPRRAPDACMRCHASRESLLPESHRVAWEQDHGEQAMARGASCDRCHDTATCVRCHETRGATAQSPHGPGFSAFHGVEARLDPQRCSSCHAGSSCSRCHQGGSLPW